MLYVPDRENSTPSFFCKTVWTNMKKLCEETVLIEVYSVYSRWMWFFKSPESTSCVVMRWHSEWSWVWVCPNKTFRRPVQWSIKRSLLTGFFHVVSRAFIEKLPPHSTNCSSLSLYPRRGNIFSSFALHGICCKINAKPGSFQKVSSRGTGVKNSSCSWSCTQK